MSYYSNSPVLFNGVSMVTATLGANDPEVGTLAEVGDEKYLFVYNAGNSQISPGYGATVSGVTGYSVTVSSVTMIDELVGVCKHSTLTTGTYGWLMVRGFGTAKMPANSGCAAGQLLTVGADGVFAVKSISTDAPGAVYGKVMVATASAGVAEAFFKIF
jgi:hypothetical protein